MILILVATVYIIHPQGKIILSLPRCWFGVNKKARRVAPGLFVLAGATGFEPAISGLTGQHVNRYTTPPEREANDTMK